MKAIYIPKLLPTFLLFTCLLTVGAVFAQNVGIGTASPNSRLDVNGALSTREGQALTLSNGGASGGINDNIVLPDISGSTGVKASFYRIVGPTAAFSIYGIVPVSSADGQELILINTTSNVMTIKNASSSIAANTIRTLTGADIISVAGNSSLSLLYNKTNTGWYVIGSQNFTTSSANLSNNSITITPGTGMSGGGSVALGGSVTLTNSGVTSLTGTANQVIVSGSTGAVTLSAPQNIHTGASPTFAGATLSGLTAGGLVKANSGTGTLSLATANTDYQAPLTGGTGITITSNVINSLWTASGTNIYNNNTANVGVGQTAPPNTFTVNNSATAVASVSTYPMAIQRAGTTDMTLGSDASYAYLQSWSNKPLLINSQANNIGIGYTTAPAYKLDVNGDIRAATTYRTTSSNGNILQVGDDAWIADVNGVNTAAILGQANSAIGALQLGSNASSYLYGTGGNIGVKTTTMLQDFNVGGRMYLANGVIQAGGTSTAINVTSDLGLYSQVSGGWIRMATNNAPIKFFTDQGGGNSAGTNDAFAINQTGQLTVAAGQNMFEFQKVSCNSDNCGVTSFGGKNYPVANWLPVVVGFNGGSASGISLYYPFSATWSVSGSNWQINLDYNGANDGSNTKTVQVMFIRRELAVIPSGSSFP